MVIYLPEGVPRMETQAHAIPKLRNYRVITGTVEIIGAGRSTIYKVLCPTHKEASPIYRPLPVLEETDDPCDDCPDEES
jgi:hypothetical protein